MADTRKIALEALYKLETQKLSISDALSLALANVIVKPQEEGFIRELVTNVIRRLNTLDWIISNFSTKIDTGTISPWIMNILRLGVCQIIYMRNRVPSYAAVDESAELAKAYSHKGVVAYVNGLLRNVDSGRSGIAYPDRKKELGKYIALKYSHPTWLVNHWLTEYGNIKTLKLCSWNNKKPDLSFRVNTLKTTRAALAKSLLSCGLQVNLPEYSRDCLRVKGLAGIASLEEYKNGHFYVQDEASSMVSHILDPQENETVLDLCAAPGGKTTHMAALMKNTGKIFAIDVYDYRLKLVDQNCARLGITNVTTFHEDIRKLNPKDFGKIDRIMLDAPCSNLGIIRRKPDIKWNKTYKDMVFNLPAYQYEVLEKVATMLKSKGVLVYSVCSMDPSETVKVIEKFLGKYPLFRLENAARFLPEPAARLVNQRGYFLTFPPGDDMDGFFAARLRKM